MISPKRTITGRDTLISIICFFAAIIVVDAILIVKAVRTFGGVDAADAYREGLAYNARIEADRRQDALGWSSAVSFADGVLRVVISDRDSRPVDGLTLGVELSRPATNRFDKRLTLSGAGDGAYVAAEPSLEPGVWVASLTAQDPNDAARLFRQRARIWNQP